MTERAAQIRLGVICVLLFSLHACGSDGVTPACAPDGGNCVTSPGDPRIEPGSGGSAGTAAGDAGTTTLLDATSEHDM